jgi:hypothetical protein
MLHIAQATGSCATAPSSYDSIVTRAALTEPTDYTIYLLAAPKAPDDPIGLRALQVGIAYPSGQGAGIKMQGWHLCTTSETPFYNWPDSGSVNTLRWDSCTNDTIQVAGYFQVSVYDPSAFALIPSPQYGVAPILDCHLGAPGILPSRLGWVSFGGATWAGDVGGCNPLKESCPDSALVRIRQVTWGKLKTKY